MATITGTNAANTLNGTTLADTINGLGGNDILNGKAGNDVIFGGIGNDSLYGDAGTDTLKGDAGNDILKGGTGLAYLYGGYDNDQLYYDPTTGNLKDVGNYLSTSSLNGDAGTDTLNLYNKATYTDGTVQKASHTTISYNGMTKGQIVFQGDSNPYSNVGSFKDIEKIIVNGAGGLTYSSGPFVTTQPEITGTEVADTFFNGPGHDTFIGRGGNDIFYVGGGTDTIVSGASDADVFHFGGWSDWSGTGVTTVSGFNNPGSHSGDKIYISDGYLSNPKAQVVESGGKTTFTTDYGEKMIVTAVGLIEGVDWFFT